MASPQKENGHLGIANEIIEALTRIRISGEEWQCLLVILRKTWGWQKKQDAIPLSQFCLATGMKKPNVCRALRKLLSKKIIDIIKKDNTDMAIYRVNKDFDTWNPLSKKTTLSKKIMPVIKKDNESLSKKIHSKDNTKDTIQKTNILTHFNEFWKAYPKKKSKANALQRWKRLKPTQELIDRILKAVQAQKTWPTWVENGGRYIPYASTWLNQKRWEDEADAGAEKPTEPSHTPKKYGKGAFV